MPDFSLEDSIGGVVCGIDEVGRGPLAGDVVAACVYIPPQARHLPFIAGVRDSKKIAKPKLAILYDEIMVHCTVGVGRCSPEEIDTLNILWATMEAMQRAYHALGMETAHALIDGNRAPKLPCSAKPIVKGDAHSKSIAAASIIAKVTRDREMEKLAQDYPHYGWESNAAYPSPQHLEAIEKYGITPHHRKSYAPVRRYIEQREQKESNSP